MSCIKILIGLWLTIKENLLGLKMRTFQSLFLLVMPKKKTSQQPERLRDSFKREVEEKSSISDYRFNVKWENEEKFSSQLRVRTIHAKLAKQIKMTKLGKSLRKISFSSSKNEENLEAKVSVEKNDVEGVA